MTTRTRLELVTRTDGADASVDPRLAVYTALLQNYSIRGRSRLGLVALVLAVYGGIVSTLYANSDFFIQAPWFVAGLLPLVPLSLTGWYMYENQVELIEASYMRSLEADLRTRYPHLTIASEPTTVGPSLNGAAGDSSRPPLSVFSAFELQNRAVAPRYVAGRMRWVVLPGMVILFGVTVMVAVLAVYRMDDRLRSCFEPLRSGPQSLDLCPPSWASGLGAEAWPSGPTTMALAIGCIYAGFFVLQFIVVRSLAFRGREIWREAVDSARTPLDEMRERRPRRLLSFVVLPRVAELIFKGVLQFVLVVLVVAALGLGFLDGTLLLVAFVGFDVLLYQSRYQLNDFLGRSDDLVEYETIPRLPILDTKLRRAVYWVSLSVRVLAAATVIGWTAHELPTGSAFVLLSGSTLVVVATIAYEMLQARLRSDGDDDEPIAVLQGRSGPPTARMVVLFVLVGLGYAIRPVVYLAVAVGSAPAGALALLGLGLWLMGMISAGTRWALQGVRLLVDPRLKSRRSYLVSVLRFSLWRQALSYSPAIADLGKAVLMSARPLSPWGGLACIGALSAAAGGSALVGQPLPPSIVVAVGGTVIALTVSPRPDEGLVTGVGWLTIAAGAAAGLVGLIAGSLQGFDAASLIPAVVIIVVYAAMLRTTFEATEGLQAALSHPVETGILALRRVSGAVGYAVREVTR